MNKNVQTKSRLSISVDIWTVARTEAYSFECKN